MVFNLVPILIFAAFMLKWERDKKYFSKEFHKAYHDGVKDGYTRGTEEWKQSIQYMAENALSKLTKEYPLNIKVIDTKPHSYDYNSGIPVGYLDIVKLPPMAITIKVQPKMEIFHKFQEWQDKWKNNA